MFVIFLIGAAVGIAGALYFLMLVKTTKKNKEDDISNEGSIIYLNFLLLNKEEVVKGTVEEKLTSRFGNSSATRKLAKKLGKFAAGRVPDAAVTGIVCVSCMAMPVLSILFCILIVFVVGICVCGFRQDWCWYHRCTSG